MISESFILKAHLFEKGIQLSKGAKELLNSKSDIWFMDNNYITCTGISMHFDSQYITVKVNPKSIYTLVEHNEKFFISENERNLIETNILFPPNYMKGNIVINGKQITKYVNTYTDRIRIQTMYGCANHCKFCNARESGYNLNDIDGLDQAFQIALAQSSAKHSFISTNNVKDQEGLKKLTEIIRFFGMKYRDKNLDLMTAPRGFTSYTNFHEYTQYLNYIKDHGINGIAVNIELNNQEKFKYYCPEKYLIGQENYFIFIEQAVKIFGINHVRSMLIVGLESLEDTLEGVEKLAQRGCNPVLSPLFPYGQANTSPNAELFIAAKEQSEQICEKYGIKMGPLCAPCTHNTL